MHHRVWTCALLLMAAAGNVEAQWQVGLGFGIEGHGRWVESSPTEVSGGPAGRPTTTWPLELDLSRGGAGHRVGVRLSHSRPGLELYDASLQVALRPAFEVRRVTPEFSVPAIHLSPGGQLRVGVGLPIEEWSFPDSADPPRWRIGALATVAIFSFQYTWNDFINPLIYINEQSKKTLALGLRDYYQMFTTTVEWQQMMAASAMMILPVILLFLFSQNVLPQLLFPFGGVFDLFVESFVLALGLDKIHLFLVIFPLRLRIGQTDSQSHDVALNFL